MLVYEINEFKNGKSYPVFVVRSFYKEEYAIEQLAEFSAINLQHGKRARTSGSVRLITINTDYASKVDYINLNSIEVIATTRWENNVLTVEKTESCKMSEADILKAVEKATLKEIIEEDKFHRRHGRK